MSGWLARLKNENMGGTHATKPTKPPQGDEKVGFVGFVAYPLAAFQKIGTGELVATKPETPSPNTDATKPTEPGIVGFVACPVAPSENFTAPQQLPANEASADADRWCWPHGAAMNTAEIDTFTARLARFTDKGLTLYDAQALSDKLVKRDRDDDHRQLCLECVHLQGVGRWSCGNWKQAGIGTRAADAGLAHGLVVMLQHCPGFREATWVR